MDEEKVSLVLAFLRVHPESAAQILERHDVDAVTRFLHETPVAFSAPVVARMSPYFSSRICKRLDPAFVVGILASLETSLIAAILRYLDKKMREQILQELSVGTRTSCNLLLRFAQNTVGAWMTQNVAIIPDDCLVSDALNTISSSADTMHTSYLFAIDRERKLCGRIHYTALLRALPAQSVKTLIDSECLALSGRMSLSQAVRHTDWDRYDVLPVLSRSGKFIGALRHVDLRKGLEQHAVRVEREPGRDPLTGILESYGTSLLALFQILGDTVETDTRVQE